MWSVQGLHLAELGDDIWLFKQVMHGRLDRHCEIVLYTLKLHIPDHGVEGFQMLGIMKKLYGPTFEKFIVYIKRQARVYHSDEHLR